MTLCSAAVADGTKTSVINALGVAVMFERADNDTDSDRDTENDTEGDLIINGESKIIETDLMATNGVLHIIDTVLTTESGTYKLQCYPRFSKRCIFNNVFVRTF